ncbi:hypothetical protein HYH03_002020 [Edaphochlamys debaryana]|uniref:F-box domain-containing protein n=1 Tax=Edaphochlamys debaryana TaxID=47281 RepID=A0A835YFV6_9CHLO|nr:hypothetical protein HYH03_002020 [Edaphochlamys debaryana]|eukprot:KAG2500453.1 hypothetical protein HYH03_002020 [Edaphochlamys debaryana]
MLQDIARLPHDVISLLLEKISSDGEQLHAVRLSCKGLRLIVDQHVAHLRVRLQPTDNAQNKLCSQFWNAGGLGKWPRCTSVTLVWDPLEVRHEDVGGPLLLPFARAPLEVRQRVRSLTVSAIFSGVRYYSDSEASDSPDSAGGDDEEDGSDEREGGEGAEEGKAPEEKLRSEEEAAETEAGEAEAGEGEVGEEEVGEAEAGEEEAGEDDEREDDAAEAEAEEQQEEDDEEDQYEEEQQEEEDEEDQYEDDDNSDSTGVQREIFPAETMQLPAQPLAALLRLLPSLHAVHLPPSSPYTDPEDGALVCSALSKLPDLRDLSISSATLAEQMGALSGLTRLTRLVVGSLDPAHDLVDGDADHHWEDDMEEEGVKAICALQGLKRLELHLWAVMQVWDTMLAHIVAALPRLELLAVRGPSAADWHDATGGHGFLGRFTTITTALAGGHITAIDVEAPSDRWTTRPDENVSLGLLAHFAKTLLLPCIAGPPGPRPGLGPGPGPGPGPQAPVERLRLRCSVELSGADPAGEWAAPLRELVGRCRAVEVEAVDASWEAAGRRVEATEVEALVTLLGLPERICLGRHSHWMHVQWVQLRRPDEPRALGCGGGGGEDAPARPSGESVEEGALKHLNRDELAPALQALWDDGTAGSELQRLRRLLEAITVPPRLEPLDHPLGFFPDYW